MHQRFLTIWMRYFKTDWYAQRHPALAQQPFVLYQHRQGRMVVTAANKHAKAAGIVDGSLLADARALQPKLHSIEEVPDFFEPKLAAFAAWCVCYAPVVALHPPLCVVLDASGCAHLWGGESAYIKHIHSRLQLLGYEAAIAMADTIGAAWAMAHFGPNFSIIPAGEQANALAPLPPNCLRLEASASERLQKLGLQKVQQLMQLPATAMHRRFGPLVVRQLQFALGYLIEHITPIVPAPQYHERLQCLEPISTAKGISIALQQLLKTLCNQLKLAQKGLRTAVFKGFRTDGEVETIALRVSLATNNAAHLQKLFELKLDTIMPAGGIELFTLEAQDLQPVAAEQELLWHKVGELTHPNIAGLVDHISTKIGTNRVRRYLPVAHHLPELALKSTLHLEDEPTDPWPNLYPRPLLLLAHPQPITTHAPPQTGPLVFKIGNATHQVVKADGPERLTPPWWIKTGIHRDYYHVEDETGNRYWLFMQENAQKSQWFLHGYCA